MKTYYYIDDERDTIKSIVDGINESSIVSVEAFPLSENKEFDKLTDFLRSKWDIFDGLILDLRLNGGGIDSTKFSATTLAQWISSFIVSECNVAKPIILLSTDFHSVHYINDITSHDLFDMVLERNEGLNWTWFAQLLDDIANGYELLNREKNLKTILQNNDIDLSAVYFNSFVDSKRFNVRQFASFVLNDLFVHPGLLISEAMLASRFGVDMERSGDDWNSFKNKYLGIAQYRGVFSKIKDLYWSKKSQEVFCELSGGKSAAAMTTIQRIETLKAVTKDECVQGLVAYNPSDGTIGRYCWTIDEASRKPLDASEGYMIQEEGGLKPWQEPRYLSFDTLESGNKGEYELIPSEKDRYEEDLANC